MKHPRAIEAVMLHATDHAIDLWGRLSSRETGYVNAEAERNIFVPVLI
jgi:hypothetical protein